MRSVYNITYYVLIVPGQLADEVIVRLNEFQDRLDSKVSPDFHTVLNIYSTYLHVRKILATAQPHVDQK